MNNDRRWNIGACRALLDKPCAQITCRIAARARRLYAIFAHPPRRFADSPVASRSLKRYSSTTICIQFEAAIDEGKVQKGLFASFPLETLKMPAQMMAALMRHQEIAIGRITRGFLRADLNAGLAVRLD